MTDYPLLVLPPARYAASHRRRGGAQPPPHVPSSEQQAIRFATRLSEVEAMLESRRLIVQDDPSGAESEMILVLETVGSVEDFYRAVKLVEGLEWIGDHIETEIKSDDDYYDSDDPRKPMRGRVYLISSSSRGLEQILTFWKQYVANPNEQFARGYAKWRNLFRLLYDIHLWGPKDRLYETGLYEEWQKRVEAGEERVRVEIELWYKPTTERRQQAAATVRRLVTEEGGIIIGEEGIVPEIGYHALLAELSITTIERLVKYSDDKLISLVLADQIMTFRPTGQAAIPLPSDDEMVIEDDVLLQSLDLPHSTPIVGMLDGLPLENHVFLQGRISVDDPEQWAGEYEVKDRVHGTGMASLIIHGELDAPDPPVSRQIYVRPILRPDMTDIRRGAEITGRAERIPYDVLSVPFIYRAVRRMYENMGDGITPVAPTVRVINFSVGEQYRLFDRFPSPLARLLDFMAEKYNILFIVSAGNHYSDILDVESDATLSQLIKSPVMLQQETVRYLNDNTRLRRLLSPAESINALTIGALHTDSAPSGSELFIDPYTNPLELAILPSPVSAQGPGFRRAPKPDVFFPGGRTTYRVPLIQRGDTKLLEPFQAAQRPPGQKVAAPSMRPPSDLLSATRYTVGTSNATALATHAAARLYDILEELRGELGDEELNELYMPVLIKALLVHSADWEDRHLTLLHAVDNLSKPAFLRWLGYGGAKIERILSGLERRATLVRWGLLSDGQAHEYALPVPECLYKRETSRSVRITLAWFSPIAPTNKTYRRAMLWVDPFGLNAQDNHMIQKFDLKRTDADVNMTRRGTVQHDVFRGKGAMLPSPSGTVSLSVSCNTDSGSGDPVQDIRYALAITIETEEELPIYEQIRTQIRPAIRI